jgi:hypothetical protein
VAVTFAKNEHQLHSKAAATTGFFDLSHHLAASASREREPHHLRARSFPRGLIQTEMADTMCLFAFVGFNPAGILNVRRKL